jgi:hypothetical protein
VENQPKLKILPSKVDTLIECLMITGLIFLWCLAVYYFNYSIDDFSLTPNHHNLEREERKVLLIILPGIATILVLLLTILNRFPHVFNYPVKITVNNAEKQYKMAMRIVRLIKFAISTMFLLIVVFITQNYQRSWLIPIIAGSAIFPLIYLIYYSFKHR